MIAAPPLRLFGRSSSHFTRVAAIVAHALGLPFELVVVHDLSRLDPSAYGGHPALKVPALHLGDRVVFGTDPICRTLVELAGRAHDPRIVLSERLDDLLRSAQALVWDAMATQVQLRVGVAVAGLPADNLFFRKASAGLAGTLAWLDERLDVLLERLPAPRDLSLLEVTLFCLLEHIAFRPTVPLAPYPDLRAFAARFAERDAARRTPFQFDPAPRPAPDPTTETR